MSDSQWRTFRSNLPLAVVLFGVYLIATWLMKKISKRQSWDLQKKLQFKAITAMIGLFLLHGLNSLKIFVILAISYAIGKLLRGKILNVAATWTFAISTLFFLEFFKGSELFPSMRWVDGFFALFPGFVPRWYVTFNITILRMISFNMDLYYLHRGTYSPLQHREHCQICSAVDGGGGGGECERMRVQEAPTESFFNFTALLAYVLYLPLYLAGPIITFNDFITQVDRPLSQPRSETIIYAMRWLGCLLLMEVFSHYFYVVAVKETRAWQGFRSVDFIILAILNLKLLWLKLLLIWRFFRLIAMLDGINTTENMERCMSNTYSGLAFWRSWHRSFNKWIIRYLYIPLGGTKKAAWNIWPIFSFVAIWHDIHLNLLIWSWLICLFILPEILLKWLCKRLDLENKSPHYLQLAALAAGGNIFLMGIANLVGFVVGFDGLKVILTAFRGLDGLVLTIILALTLYAIGHVQLQIRRTEVSLGINKNY